MKSNLERLPVIPFDEINDPVGMHRQGLKFAAWARNLPNEPIEVSLSYAPFDVVPRSWDYRVLSDDEPRQISLWMNVYDVFFDELQETANLAALPPEDESFDEDGPNWHVGFFALLVNLEEVLFDLQTDYLARCFDYIGWSAETFIEETDAYMNPLQQRIFLQGYSYMYELERILREHFDELTPHEQATFPDMLEGIKQEYLDKIAEFRVAFENDMDEALNKMLDGDA